MQYEVDLSKVGCNCVTNVMGVAMPSLDPNADDFGSCMATGDTLCPQ